MKMIINNENQTYTYQIFMDTCNGENYQNNISTCEETKT